MKRACAFLASIVLAVPLMAIDFGFDLLNTSALGASDKTVFSQRDTVTGWFGHTDETWQFKIEGFYKFSGDFGNTKTIVPYRFDFNNVYFMAQFPELLGPGSLSSLQVGRFRFQDSSTRIIDNLSDGLSFRYSYGTLDVSVFGAFTGLSAQEEANIVISSADFLQYQNPATKPYFAPNRIFAGVKGKILELFERHDLALEIIGQFDLRPTDPLNTYYAELSAEGRPLQWLKWRLYGIAELWGDARSSWSMAAGLRGQFSVPELLGLVGVLNVEWASGSEKPFRQFCPINQGIVAQIYPAVFADTVTANLNLAIRPFQGFSVGGSGYGIFRASSNVPADTQYPSSGTAPYLGTEGILNVDWTYGEELTVGLKGGAFFPNTAADAYGSAAVPRWLASLELKLML